MISSGQNGINLWKWTQDTLTNTKTPAWLYPEEMMKLELIGSQTAASYRTLSAWLSLLSRPYSQSAAVHLTLSEFEFALFDAGSAGIRT